MKEKNRLRRRCEQCSNVFDVARKVESDWYDGSKDSGPVRVQWNSDPFASEICDNHTLMWICDRCYYDSMMEI